jgi:hypothetical protein
MTCVIGLIHEGEIWMGYDSSSVGGYDMRETKLCKAFTVDRFAIGYTDSFRMGQLLQYELKIPPQAGPDDLEGMVTVFIPAVRRLFMDNGFSIDNSGGIKSGHCMVGYNGRLFFIDDDFQVNEYSDEFSAIGHAAPYALGAMYSNSHISDPAERILDALNAACRFSASTVDPLVVSKMIDRGIIE